MVLNCSLSHTRVKGVAGYLPHCAEDVIQEINITEKRKSSVLIGCYSCDTELLKSPHSSISWYLFLTLQSENAFHMFLYPKVSIHGLFYILFLSCPVSQLSFCAFSLPLKHPSSQSLTIPISISLSVQFFPSQSLLYPDISIMNTAGPAFHILDRLLIISTCLGCWTQLGRQGKGFHAKS